MGVVYVGPHRLGTLAEEEGDDYGDDVFEDNDPEELATDAADLKVSD